MRKQTKLVAVLSAAALLALGASMTSFAAGWEKDEAGVWHYYDADDDMVTGEWKKDGGKWFYLDDDGDMLTNGWVDDEYYVGEDGAMLVNQWIKTYADEDQDDPTEDGENWYYFDSKGKKVTTHKKINGKTYYFDTDGKMKTGWQDINGYAYYLGTEDEGWRAENQWLWLEKSGLIEDDDLDGMKVLGCNDTDGEVCDSEGWYWFQSSGKVYNESSKKKINGKYYIFNEHGQMLYEWINSDTTRKVASNAQLDGKASPSVSVAQMLYYEQVEDGSRVTGWRQIDGAEDVGTDNDTNWYYFDDGEAEHAVVADDYVTTENDGTQIYRARIKVEGKYFCFDQKGKMKTGLQYIPAQGAFYSFDDNGYMQTGKINSVECDDDDYTFYFEKKNGKNGQGVTGEKDGYLYYKGKRLEADDDNRLYYVDGEIYLVNNKGKIQKAKSGKKFDIENAGINAEDVYVVTNGDGKVSSIAIDVDGDKAYDGSNDKSYSDTNLRATIVTALTNDKGNLDFDLVKKDAMVSVPFIELHDNIFTYNITATADLSNKLTSDWQ